MKIDINNILVACDGQLIVDNISDNVVFGNAVIDSRKINKGDIFFAIKGENVDGHDYVLDVVKAGASIVIADKIIDDEIIEQIKKTNTCLVRVDNTTAALQQIAAMWRNQINAKVIGITGSVGKTTTKNICNSLISCAYKTTCNDGNLNNELGLPITVCKSNEDDDYLITEMGMSAFGEIEDLCKIAKPNWGLITNIGQAHMEFLGSQENIAKAKAELAQALPDNSGKLFLYTDDKYKDFIVDYAKLKDRNIEIIYFGADKFYPNLNANQVWFENESCNNDAEYSFDLCVFGFGNDDATKKHVSLILKGKHNIVNACGAIAVALMAGVKLDAICEELGKLCSDSGRQEVLVSKTGFKIINDSYNANPASTIASINMFSKISTEGKKIAFLGDMFELGDFETEGHKSVGKNAAQNNLDVLICVGNLSKNIYSGAIDSGMNKNNVYWCESLEEAKNLLLSIVAANDVVLFKASNSMNFSSIIDDLVR